MDEGLRRRAEQVRTEWTLTRVTAHSPGWMEWEQLMAPYLDACDELRDGFPDHLEDAIRFLETRPRVFRSGYLAERILRFVDRVELSPTDRERVLDAARNIIREGPTREARRAGLLIARLTNTPPPERKRDPFGTAYLYSSKLGLTVD